MTIEEWDQRIQNAKTHREWMVLMNSCPEPNPDDGYDVIEELNALRRASGARLLTNDPRA